MGTTYFTQPAEATLAFPPEGYELPYMPTLHVRNGAPSPTVSQCAFPALSCPTSDTLSIRLTRGGVKGPSPDNIELHFWQGPNEIPDDDPDEAEAGSCSISDEEEDPDDDPDDTGEPDTPEEPGVEPPVIPPPVEPVVPPFIPFPFPWAPIVVGNHTLTFVSTQTATTKTTAPEPTKTLIAPTTRPKATTTVAFETPMPAMETPDFSKDPKPSCYNKGPSSPRSWMVKAIDSVCNQVTDRLSQEKSTDIGPGLFDPGRQRVDETPKLVEGVHWEFTTTFEVKENCMWKKYSFSDCAAQFRRLVDECDTKGENGKHGGVLDGNCVRWRLEMYVEGLDTIK
jgi:hypothetical protein